MGLQEYLHCIFIYILPRMSFHYTWNKTHAPQYGHQPCMQPSYAVDLSTTPTMPSLFVFNSSFLFLIHGNCFVFCCHRAFVLSALTALTSGLHPATFSSFSRSYLSCTSSGNPSLNPSGPHRLGYTFKTFPGSL